MDRGRKATLERFMASRDRQNNFLEGFCGRNDKGVKSKAPVKAGKGSSLLLTHVNLLLFCMEKISDTNLDHQNQK